MIAAGVKTPLRQSRASGVPVIRRKPFNAKAERSKARKDYFIHWLLEDLNPDRGSTY
jgi:hypothetical protein